MKNYYFREKIPDTVSENLKAYPELMRTLLFSRGIDEATKAETFLKPNYETGLHDPYLLKDMNKAVERIIRAMKDNERILIYTDYDADGIPAGVILSDFFKSISYLNVEVYIPHRHNEGYGLHLEAIETFKDRIKLLITLDSGIVDCDEVLRANELGIDVIITDHHLPRRSLTKVGEAQQELPPAYAVIDAHQTGCEYPFDYLCGSGIAFKLVQALLIKLRQPGDPPFTLKNGQEKWLLDMVGIATLSDMVPLQGENRVLAHYGLKVLRKNRRPGLQKLLGKLKIDARNLNEDDIGFMIAPRINAASRMGLPKDAYDLLSTTDEVLAGTLADHLDEINNERKGIVASTVKEIKKIIAERQDHYISRGIIVLGNPNWRPALLGLAASSLVEEYNKPVFLWGREEGKDIKGSCRSDGSVDLVELMSSRKDLFREFGGHSMAGGFAVDHERIHTLDDELAAAYELVKREQPMGENSFIDAKLSLDDVNEKTYRVVAELAPFGVGNAKPQFMFENVYPSEIKQFGKAAEHLELVFLNSNERKIKAIGFFMDVNDFSVRPTKGIPMTLIATLEKSYFRNFPELRLRIVDSI